MYLSLLQISEYKSVFLSYLRYSFLGIAFDLAATLLMKEKHRGFFRSSLTGVISAYSGHALFALIITYIIRFEYWIGLNGKSFVEHHPRWAYSSAVIVLLLLWILG